jgi:hypothetical protein
MEAPVDGTSSLFRLPFFDVLASATATKEVRDQRSGSKRDEAGQPEFVGPGRILAVGTTRGLDRAFFAKEMLGEVTIIEDSDGIYAEVDLGGVYTSSGAEERT